MLGKEPIFTIYAELEAITSLGRTPYGERRVIGILGGTVRGPKLAGRILPGALVMVNSEGLRHGPPDVIEKLARGENVDPRHYYFRTVMRFETAAPSVDWLNRILAIAKGQREPRAVRLDVYEVE
jgi:hypothetical protein